jgi:hypothetical protein
VRPFSLEGRDMGYFVIVAILGAFWLAYEAV